MNNNKIISSNIVLFSTKTEKITSFVENKINLTYNNCYLG
jgi:hypothetical protein